MRKTEVQAIEKLLAKLTWFPPQKYISYYLQGYDSKRRLYTVK
jgi:hypothetical protein